MKEADLHSAIGSLPRSKKPGRDLWPAISERLETVDRESITLHKYPFWRTPALAAAVLLALTTGIFIGRGMDMGSAGQMSETVQEYALIGAVKATELAGEPIRAQMARPDGPTASGRESA